MLRAFRPRPAPPIQRSADGNPWAGYSASSHFGGSSNPMAIPAFYRGMAHRITIVSTLPLRAEVGDQSVGVPIEILDQPDPAEDRQVTLARMESSLVTRGEIVAVKGSFDTDGYPRSIKVVDPRKAKLERDGSWTIAGRRFPAWQILWHAPIILPGESRGVSVVELFRRTFQGELAATDYQANFYLDGGQPTTALVNSDPEATTEDIEEMVRRYQAKVSGGRREPIGLPATIEVRTFPLTNSDSQFLESRQFALIDVANIVGVPPYWVGAPGSTTVYSNLTQERQNLLDIYLRGSLYAIERAMTTLLPEGMKAKFDASSFLRWDPKGTADTLAVESQWMTIDEIRAVRGLAPLPNGAGAVLAGSLLPGAPPAPTTQEATADA